VAVLGEIDAVVCAAERGLEMRNKGVDPAEGLQVAGLAGANDNGAVLSDDRAGSPSSGRRTRLGQTSAAAAWLNLRRGHVL
jgi:hypothetical protein